MNKRYASMDLLRSAAILLVIVAHSVLSYGAPDHLAPLQFGGNGVDLFFVLSGWLLGGQLFKELLDTRAVDVRRFWFRRWMRTLPAYYAVLAASLLQRYLTKSDVEFPIEYFVFLQNYNHPLEFFSISWSLAVEEQFYLVIAPLVAASLWTGRRTLLLCLLVLLVLPFIFRTLQWYGNAEQTHVRLDGCVAGVLLAYFNHHLRDAWRSLCRFAVPLATLGLAVYLFYFVERYFPQWGVGAPDKLLLAMIFCSWVVLANSSDRCRSVLYVPGCHYVATRSYSMYLLHHEALAVMRRVSDVLPFPIYLCAVLLLTFALSEVLFRVVESPFMALRERLEPTRSLTRAGVN